MKSATPLEAAEIRLYTIYYPSGTVFSLEGVFSAVVIDGDFSPALKRAPGSDEITILDPRAVITRKEGIVYEPRKYPRGGWVDDWLREHPEWPPLDLRGDGAVRR